MVRLQWLALASLVPGALMEKTAASGSKNLLYFVVDDLTAYFASFGGQYAIPTPNLDRLLATGTQFTRAYTQFAVCSPSRQSFLSGLRPDTTKAYTFVGSFRRYFPDHVSLPELFKYNNYSTYGFGKVFHDGTPPNNDLPYSWSDDYDYYQPPTDSCPRKTTIDNFWCAFPSENASDYTDGKHVTAAINRIAAVKDRKQPWALFVGIRKPHLPFYIPQKFLDQQLALDQIPLPEDKTLPAGIPLVAWQNASELANVVNTLNPYNPLPDDTIRTFRRYYWGAVSWMDWNVGRLLDYLDNTGLSKTTTVVFHADHGWQLGEKGLYTKQTEFELATRVPLIIRDPSIPSTTPRRKTKQIVELLDIYPTLADLFQLKGVPTNLQGKSLKTLLTSDKLQQKQETYAFSQFTRCLNTNPVIAAGGGPAGYPYIGCEGIGNSRIAVLGLSVRTDTYRYTEWLKFNGTSVTALWDQPRVGYELYAHNEDGATQVRDEYQNLYTTADAVVKSKLAKIIKDQFYGPTTAPLPAIPIVDGKPFNDLVAPPSKAKTSSSEAPIASR